MSSRALSTSVTVRQSGLGWPSSTAGPTPVPLDRTGVRCHGQGVGWRNPPVPWSELERTALGPSPRPVGETDCPGANGGDSPAWSRKRPAYEPPSGLLRAGRGTVPYAELHCHSNFTFLDGASHPEELAEEAARLGLEALALTDHDGFYGVVRFAEAARAVGLPTVFGAELTLDGPTEPAERRWPTRRATTWSSWPGTRGLRPPGPGGQPGPDGGGEGRAAHRARRPRPTLAGGTTGSCSPAAARARCPRRSSGGPGRGRAGARRAGRRLRAGQRRRRAVGPRRPARLAPATTPWPRWPCAAGVGLVATNNVHYATPAAPPAGHRPGRGAGPAQPRRDRRLAARRRRRPPALGRASRPAASPATRAWSSARPSWVGSAPSTCRWSPRTCRRSRARDGLDEMAYLRQLTERGAPARPLRPVGQTPSGSEPSGPSAQIDHELDVIEQLGFPGYFLIVWDIVQFCQRGRHLLPGSRVGGQQRGLLRPRDHQRRRRRASACCSSGSCRPSGTARPTSTSTSRATAARRPSSTSTTATAGRTPPRWPTSSPTGPARRCGTWPRRSAHVTGQQDAWSKQIDAVGRRQPTRLSRRRTTRSRRRCWTWRPRSSTSPGTSASTPAAW